MRKIRKFYGKLWTKIIAMLLCMVSVVGLAGSGIGITVCALQSQEEWQKDIYEKLESGYSALAMRHFVEAGYAEADTSKDKGVGADHAEGDKAQGGNNKEDNSMANDMLKIPELENTNFKYAILKSEAEVTADVDLSDKKSYVVGEPMEDYDYITWAGEEGETIDVWGDFHTNSLPSALMSTVGIDSHSDEDLQVERINEFVYSREDEMIYAQTNKGYFPLNEFNLYRPMSANEEPVTAEEPEVNEEPEDIRGAAEQEPNVNKEPAMDEEQEETSITDETSMAAGESAEKENVIKAGNGAQEISSKQEDEAAEENKSAGEAESTEEMGVEDEGEYEYGSELYGVYVALGESEEGTFQSFTDMYRPDVKNLKEDYLKDSLYIYFQDEVLYWNKEALFRLCEGTSLGDVKRYFGDSLWPLKFVDDVPAKEVKECSYFENNSESNRGWVYFNPTSEKPANYWIVSKYVENGEYDLFTEANRWIELVYSMQNVYGLLLLLSLVVFVAGFLYLMAAAGVQEGEELCMTVWHRLPLAVYTCGAVGVEALIGVGLAGWLAYGIRLESVDLWLITVIPMVMLMAMIGIMYCMNISVRIKTKTFWRYTLLYYLVAFIKKYVIQPLKKAMKLLWEKMVKPLKSAMKFMRENASLMRKTIIILVIVYFVELLIMVPSLLACGVYDDGVIVVLVFLYTCLSAVKALVVILAVKQMQQLQEGSRRIAVGNLEQPIDTSRMFWEFKKHGENINSVGDGINAAVQERMKSEHFKTELITNVSHDIKTPLTSIINYVDLMKKQDIKDETMLEYMDVLDRQSARLKKLIEDLMEASKASTGNLTVNWEKMDVTVLLTQVVGEYEERLNAKGLELIVDSPNPPIYIRADGRHLWRVFDNLMNNICKYAQTGTRVYINMSSLAPEANQVSIVFRNISASQLNISSEELMERFVRGDSSRNTEGSGLGLSIAQSLTELMHGTLELNVDGDLFKVILQFPLEG